MPGLAALIKAPYPEAEIRRFVRLPRVFRPLPEPLERPTCEPNNEYMSRLQDDTAVKTNWTLTP